MTRCVACNKLLSDFESTRKIEREDGTSDYPDLCNKCFKSSELAEYVPIVERSDLQHEEDITDELYNEDGNFPCTSYNEDEEDEE